MGIRDYFRAARRDRIIKAAIAAGLTVPSSANIRSPRHIFFLRGDYTLKNSEIIFAAVSRIANSLSAMPAALYKGAKKAEDEDLCDLIGFAPNPSMTSSTFFKTMEACRNTNGNCYAMKVYNPAGQVERLDVLDPSRVEPVMETDSMELWYRITPEKGPQMYVHNYNVIHVPFVSTNGYKGISPIAVLQDTLQYADMVQRFSRAQLDDGVNAKIVLEAPANLGDVQKEEMIQSFLKTYKETSGSILLLESGVQAKTVNMSPIDSKIFEVEKITRSKVAMVYNIPPHLMGDYSETSYNSQEQQMLEFLQLTMLPIVSAWEQELNRKLLTKEMRAEGYRFEFNMEEMLRADSATRADVNQKSIRGGWCTVNEVRAMYNMEPIPEGNTALAARDLAPLNWIIEHPDGTDRAPAAPVPKTPEK